jgi:hypothetical protein
MTHHIIDDYHHATIHQTPGGWRVCILKRSSDKPRIIHTDLYPSRQHAEEYIQLCKKHGVDSAGICCLYTQRAYVTRKQYRKPEYQK